MTEAEAIYFKYVVLGRSTALWWRVSHPKVQIAQIGLGELLGKNRGIQSWVGLGADLGGVRGGI